MSLVAIYSTDQNNLKNFGRWTITQGAFDQNHFQIRPKGSQNQCCCFFCHYFSFMSVFFQSNDHAYQLSWACADPGFFVRGGGGGVGVGGGGGGVQVRWPENRLDNIFGFFFSPQLTLQFTEGFQ